MATRAGLLVVGDDATIVEGHPVAVAPAADGPWGSKRHITRGHHLLAVGGEQGQVAVEALGETFRPDLARRRLGRQRLHEHLGQVVGVALEGRSVRDEHRQRGGTDHAQDRHADHSGVDLEPQPHDGLRQ